MTDEVFEQIMAVRESGVCNMFDTTAVQRYAYDHGMYALTLYIEENKKDYVHFILHGKVAGDEVSE